METITQGDRYLTASQVRERFGGISAMSLWRWLKDDALGFPRPMVVNRRRLFSETEINRWAAARSSKAA